MCHAAMIPRPAVSTHSRPKAAGTFTSKDDAATEKFQHTAARRRLARTRGITRINIKGFNTQPPEGGWSIVNFPCVFVCVSTHSRPKAAGTLR